MVRRKSKRKPPSMHKALRPLQLRFNCPFCVHDGSCEVKLDKARKIGEVKCNYCQESFRSEINYLSIPVDVYNDWIDACDVVNW